MLSRADLQPRRVLTVIAYTMKRNKDRLDI